MIDVHFFTQLREMYRTPAGAQPPLFHNFTQMQVDALNTVTACFDAFTGHDHCTDDLAYIMATCYRECGAELDLTIEERGHGATKPYGKPAGPYGKRYFGRGPTQTTWYDNYRKAELATGIPFVQYPELMSDPTKSVVYMIDAMYAGRFTKYGLRNFIQPGIPTSYEHFRVARKIINGMDHADEVATHAVAFQAALNVGYTPPVKVPSTTKQSSSGAPRQGLLSLILSYLVRM